MNPTASIPMVRPSSNMRRVRRAQLKGSCHNMPCDSSGPGVAWGRSLRGDNLGLSTLGNLTFGKFIVFIDLELEVMKFNHAYFNMSVCGHDLLPTNGEFLVSRFSQGIGR
jgi:hypothetical protein